MNISHYYRSSRLSAFWIGFIFMLVYSPKVWGDCDPTFGQDTLSWVSNTVAQQSRDLAKADFRSRALNYQIIGRQDVIGRAQAESADLQAISDELAKLDAASSSTASEEAIAVQRDQTSQLILSALYRVRSDLSETRRRLDQLDAPPTRDYFNRNGLGNVGRASLLSSLQELGDASEHIMGARYKIYVQVTFNEDGSAKITDIDTAAGIADTVGVALLYYPPPVDLIGAGLIALSTMYQLFEIGDCNNKYDHQKALLQQANSLVPSKLITPDEQWLLYKSTFEDQQKIFCPTSPSIRQTIDALDERWKGLFAANAARSAAAQAALTDVKVKQIQKDYANGDLQGIFRNIALIDIASDISTLNGYVASTPAALDISCINAQGLTAQENGLDGLDFAEAQLSAFRSGNNFSPLFPLIDHGLDLVARARAHIYRSGPTGAKRTCDRIGPPQFRALTAKASNRAKIKGRAKIKAHNVLTQLPLWEQVNKALVRNFINDSTQNATDFTVVSTCVLVRYGNAYSCGIPGAGYSSYDSQFWHGSGNPESDVLWGANDGGYASDGRKMQAEVRAASANIDSRIHGLTASADSVSAAVPNWIGTNGAALTQAATIIDQAKKADADRESAFVVTNAAMLRDIKVRLEDFTRSPLDPATTKSLIDKAGGVDFRLSSFPTEKIHGNVPVIAGITAPDRAYGSNKTEFLRRIERERLKANRELRGDRHGLSDEMLDEAVKLNAHGANTMAEQLLLDAASLRFAGNGALPAAQVTTVGEDGSFSQSPLQDDGKLPPNALLRLTENFDAQDRAFTTRSSALRSTLEGDGADAAHRRSVLDLADTVEHVATRTFFSGDLKGGETMMRYAMAALDIASRFVPGVNWGRDIYEAISGKDMFTGHDLDSFNRTIAILGVVTLGIADDASGLVHAAEELKTLEKVADLGASGKKAEEILEVAQEISHDVGVIHTADELKTLEQLAGLGVSGEKQIEILKAASEINSATKFKFSDHAVEMAFQRGIDSGVVDEALNHGTRFWTTTKESILFVQDVPMQGMERASVAIDISRMEVKTVFFAPETDAQLLKKIVDAEEYRSTPLWGKPYFTRIPTPYE